MESSSNLGCSGDVTKLVGSSRGHEQKIQEEVRDSRLTIASNKRKNSKKKAHRPLSTAGGRGEGGGGGEGRVEQPVLPSSTASSTVVLNPESQQRLVSVLTSPKALSHLKDVNFYVTVKEGSNTQQVNSCMQETLHGNENSVQAQNHRDCPTATNDSRVNNLSNAQVAATNGSQNLISHPLLPFSDNIGGQVAAILKLLVTHNPPTTATTTISGGGRLLETRMKHQLGSSDLKKKARSRSMGTVTPSLSSSPSFLEDGAHRIIQIDFSAPQASLAKQAHDGGKAIDSGPNLGVGGTNGGGTDSGVGWKTSDDGEINNLSESQGSVALLHCPLSPSQVSTGDSLSPVSQVPTVSISTIPPHSRNVRNGSPLYSNDLRRNVIGHSQNFSCEVLSRFSKRSFKSVREPKVIVLDDDSEVQVNEPALNEVAEYKKKDEDVVILGEERDSQFQHGAFVSDEPVSKKRKISNGGEAEEVVIVRHLQAATTGRSVAISGPTSQKGKVVKTGKTGESNQTSHGNHVTDSYLGKDGKEAMETDLQVPFIDCNVFHGVSPGPHDSVSGNHTLVEANGLIRGKESDDIRRDPGFQNSSDSDSSVVGKVLTGTAWPTRCSRSPRPSNTGDISPTKETTPTADNAECLHSLIPSPTSGERFHKEQISWACKDHSHKLSSPASSSAMCTLRSPRVVLSSLTADTFRKYQSSSTRDRDKDRPPSTSLPVSPSTTLTKSLEVPSPSSNDESDVDQSLRPCEREGDLPVGVPLLPSPSAASLIRMPLPISKNVHKDRTKTTRDKDSCRQPISPLTSPSATSMLTRLPLRFQATGDFNEEEPELMDCEGDGEKSVIKALQSAASLSPTVGFTSPVHSVDYLHKGADFVSDEHLKHGHFVPSVHKCVTEKKRKEKKAKKKLSKKKKAMRVENEVDNHESFINQPIPLSGGDIKKYRGVNEPPLLFNMEDQPTPLSENDIDYSGSDKLTLSRNVEGQPTPLSDDDVNNGNGCNELSLSQNMEGQPTPLSDHDMGSNELPLSQNVEGQPMPLSNHDTTRVSNELPLSQNIEGQPTPLSDHDISRVSNELPLSQNMEGQPMPLFDHDINDDRGSNQLHLSQNVEGQPNDGRDSNEFTDVEGQLSLFDHDCRTSQNMKGQPMPLSDHDMGSNELPFSQNVEGQPNNGRDSNDVEYQPPLSDDDYRGSNELTLSQNMESQPYFLSDNDCNSSNELTLSQNMEGQAHPLSDNDCRGVNEFTLSQNMEGQPTPLSDHEITSCRGVSELLSHNLEDESNWRSADELPFPENMESQPTPLLNNECQSVNEPTFPENVEGIHGGNSSTELPIADHVVKIQSQTIRPPPLSDGDIDDQRGANHHPVSDNKEDNDEESRPNGNEPPHVCDDEVRFCSQEVYQVLDLDDQLNQEGATWLSPSSTDKNVDNEVGIKQHPLYSREDVQSRGDANQPPLSDSEEATDNPRGTNLLASFSNAEGYQKGIDEPHLSNSSKKRGDSPPPLSHNAKSTSDQMFTGLMAASEDSGRGVRSSETQGSLSDNQYCGDNPPREELGKRESQSMDSTRPSVCPTLVSLPTQAPTDQKEQLNVESPPVDLMVVEQYDCDDRSSSTSGIVTTSARFRKEWSVANSDSLSHRLLSRSSSCSLSDSFNSSDRFSLAESCRRFSDDTHESGSVGVFEKNVERPSSLPRSLSSSSLRQRKSWEPSLYASTKVIMTRSKFANLKKIGDSAMISQALISPHHDTVRLSESFASPPECISSSTNRHMNKRSLSVSSLDSAASSSSAVSLLGDSRDRSGNR